MHLSPTDAVCLPDDAQTRFSTPSEVAGGPRTNEVLKCRLTAIKPSDYGLLGLSASQLQRLRKVFPKGVCDWSRPGVGQQSVVAWQTYQDARGKVVVGGGPCLPRRVPGADLRARSDGFWAVSPD